MKSLNVLIHSDESAACPRPLNTARHSSDGCSGQQKQPCNWSHCNSSITTALVPDMGFGSCLQSRTSSNLFNTVTFGDA